MSYSLPRLSLGIAVVVALATAVGCSSPDTDAAEAVTTPSAQSSDATTASLLPAEFVSKGKLVWGVEPYYPPFSMAGTDNKTLVGLNIDLANKISEVLGVKAEISQGVFDSLIPGIQANRFDLVIDAMADLEERRKLVNFIDYFQSGSAIFVAAGNPLGIKGIEDLCGHKVAAVKASFEVNSAEDQRDKCKAGGNKELQVQVYPDESAMLLAVTSGRSDSMLMDQAMGAYAAKQAQGKFELSGPITEPLRKGILVAKSNTDLMKAVQQAVQVLIDNGQYGEILKTWGEEGGAVTKTTINDGKGQ